MIDGGDTLTELSRIVLQEEIIRVDFRNKQIYSAALNPLDNDRVTPDIVNRISILLYEKLAQADFEYDAIASIPTGGDPYAEQLARIIGSLEGRHVQSHRYDSACLPQGSRIVLVDDVLVGGYTAADAIEQTEKAGHSVIATLFAADLQRFGTHAITRYKRKPILSVFTSTQIWSMCAD
jgi:orotate phosphoribosyltransferase